MERIRIKNFLTIEEASIDVRPICILIGPQASGKSVIAKLLFFCREGVKTTLRSSVEREHSFDEFKNSLSKVFGSYFKRDYWDGEPFNVQYEFGDYSIGLRRTKKSNGNINITLSPQIEDWFIRTQAEFLAARRNRQIDFEHKVTEPFLFFDFWHEVIKNDPLDALLKSQIFIPSSRAFFVLFQKRMFSFLAGPSGGPTNIDPFLRDFGPKYEGVKDVIGRLKFEDEITQRLYAKICERRREILRGDYIREREGEYILDPQRRRKTRVEDASSGQQEALPMLAILSEWPLLAPRDTRYFIEEPEAHLFPSSQKAMVELIALIYKKRKHQFVITTHSPYILTALNNLIFAEEVSKAADVSKIVDPDTLVSFDDVVAYSVKDGHAININEEENRLIGSSIIDSVSDEFSEIFEKLMTLLGEKQNEFKRLPRENKK